MKNMSVKENTKFPIAVVFYVLSVLYSGLNILVSFVQIYQEHTIRVALGAVFASCLRLILPLAIILLLFLKKRNVLLFLALGMQSVFSAMTAGSELFRARHMDMMETDPMYYMRGPMYGMSKMITILLCVIMFLFAIDCLCSVEKPYNLFLKKIWFLPIVLYALIGMFTFLSGPMWLMLSSLIPMILSCATAVTLNWWITRPYKNGYVPAQEAAQQPYPASNAPYEASAQAAWQTPQVPSASSVCLRCGNPIKAQNAFCTYCGAPLQSAATSRDTAPIQRGTAAPGDTEPIQHGTAASGDTAPIQRGTAIPVGDSALGYRR